MTTKTTKPTDPLTILAGIKQFGLAPDGSDLRDLEIAIAHYSTITSTGDQATDLPEIPNDDADFTPELARKIISKYQQLLTNPAQVTDAMVEKCVKVCPQCEGEGSYADGLDEAACTTECTRCDGNGWIVDTAAIGAGGQAVAREDVAYFTHDKWGGYWQTVRDGKPYNFRLQPHPADERVVEAANTVLKWLDGGCSSWGVPEQQLRTLALAAKEGR